MPNQNADVLDFSVIWSLWAIRCHKKGVKEFPNFHVSFCFRKEPAIKSKWKATVLLHFLKGIFTVASGPNTYCPCPLLEHWQHWIVVISVKQCLLQLYWWYIRYKTLKYHRTICDVFLLETVIKMTQLGELPLFIFAAKWFWGLLYWVMAQFFCMSE